MTANDPPALPEAEPSRAARLPSRLEPPLVETARAYARAATSKNTNRAYAADCRPRLERAHLSGRHARAEIGVIAESVPNPTLSRVEEFSARVS